MGTLGRSSLDDRIVTGLCIAMTALAACSDASTSPGRAPHPFVSSRLVSPAVVLTNACNNSATGGYDEISVNLTGTAPASVSPGASFSLTGLGLSLQIQGQFFVAAYNLGLLPNGGSVPGTVQAVIEGTNTVEGTQSTNNVAVVIGPVTISDPDGTPGTGDESAAPVGISANFANQTWTAGAGGTILFREETVPLAVNQGGIVINATIGGIVNLQIRCSPGTVDDVTEVPTFIDPAAPFAVTQISIPGDMTLDVVVNGQTRSDVLYTTVAADVANVGSVSMEVCDSDVLWDIEVNGVNTTGFVLPSNPGCTTVAPGHKVRFRYKWVHGPGELVPGATVVRYTGTLSFADEDPSTNTDTELRIAN